MVAKFLAISLNSVLSLVPVKKENKNMRIMSRFRKFICTVVLSISIINLSGCIDVGSPEGGVYIDANQLNRALFIKRASFFAAFISSLVPLVGEDILVSFFVQLPQELGSAMYVSSFNVDVPANDQFDPDNSSLVDPLILQLPTSANDFEVIFDDGAGSNGNMVITEVANCLEMLPGAQLCPEVGHKIVIVEFPAEFAPSNNVYTFAMGFVTGDPTLQSMEIKAFSTLKLAFTSGRVYYPPVAMAPCTAQTLANPTFDNAATFTIPVVASGNDLQSLTPGNLNELTQCSDQDNNAFFTIVIPEQSVNDEVYQDQFETPTL